MARRYSHRPLFPNPVVSFFLFWLGYILNGSTLPPSVTFCTARYDPCPSTGQRSRIAAAASRSISCFAYRVPVSRFSWPELALIIARKGIPPIAWLWRFDSPPRRVRGNDRSGYGWPIGQLKRHIKFESDAKATT